MSGGRPRLASWLVSRAVPVDWAGDSLMADLEEEFRVRSERNGFRARCWYWHAAIQIAAAYLWDGVRRSREGSRELPAGMDASGRTGPRLLPGLVQDLRFAARSFRRSPGFTILAAVTLALGIASATSVFSVADGVLLRPLRYPAPERLVHVWMSRRAESERRGVVAGATYLDWEREAGSFEEFAAYRAIDFNLTGDGYPERVTGVSITPGFFPTLGIGAALGILPGPDDPEAFAGTTVVLSDALWKARFGADPSIVGASIVLNGKPYTVVAVLPAGVEFPDEARLWVPSPYRVPLTPVDDADRSTDRTAGYLTVLGRLAEGRSLETAHAEMNAINAGIRDAIGEDDEEWSVSVVPLQEDLVGDLRPTFIMLLGAVGLLLLVACANVANLLTIRATRRRQELAVRVSLGAGLARIRRQLLTESVFLALCGGLPGVLLAIWGTRVLVSLAPDDIPRLAEVAVDPRVVGFSLIVTFLTGLAFGLAPVIGLAKGSSAAVLRGGTARGRPRSERLRDSVVIAEVALSLLLVIGAGLMLRTFRALNATEPGFDPAGVLVAHVSLPQAEYPDATAQAAFYEEALTRIRALPGVESASTILTLPMHWAIRGTFHFSVQGRVPESEDEQLAGYQVASTDFFRTLRIPIHQGRTLAPNDREESPGVVVINEAMARRYWPGEDPVGEQITFWGDPTDPETEWSTIVGVVGNTVKDGLDTPPEPEVYMPVSQAAMSRSSFVIRTGGDPYILASVVRQSIEEIDPALPLYGLLSLEDVLSSSLDPRRFRLVLLGIFAAAALLLAAIGLYGVISFSVSQRTREIGIRMALGAEREAVVGHVVRQGISRVLLGLALGTLGSLALAGVISSQVFGVTATDPLTYMTSALVLAAVALLACLAPAIRAARVNPAVAVKVD